MHRRLENLYRRRGVSACGLQRVVDVAQQGFGVVAVIACRQADPASDMQRMPGAQSGKRGQIEQASCGFQRLVVGCVQQNGELIAAQTGKDVAAA